MRYLAPVIAVLLLAACSSMSSQASYQVDDDYISRVEKGAQIGGGKVYWLNPPVKRVLPVKQVNS